MNKQKLIEFLKYVKQQRNDFVKIAGTYSVGKHNKLRTEIDSLLIAYDQMAERLHISTQSQQQGVDQPNEEKECTRDDLVKLFYELQTKAYNEEYHNYYYKETNQIIREFFDNNILEPPPEVEEKKSCSRCSHYYTRGDHNDCDSCNDEYSNFNPPKQ